MTRDHVDFLLFEFQEGAARTGVTAVSGSLEPDDWALWTERLGIFTPLPERASRPSTAYLSAGRDMVLLHRAPAKDTRQRDSTRTLALIGPPSVLTFPRAALLLRAPAEPDPATWTGVGYPSAWVVASHPDDDLRRDLEPYRAELVALVAAIQDGPRARFQFRTDLHCCSLLLGAAYDCSSGYLPGPGPDWTFSTSPTAERDGSVERPQFVFGAGEPARTGQGSSRRRIDLSLTPHNAVEAEDLVDDWFRYGPREPARTPPFGPVPTQPTQPSRVRLVTAAANSGVDWLPVDGSLPGASPRYAEHAVPVGRAESAGHERHTGSEWHPAPADHAASAGPSVPSTAPTGEPRDHRRAPFTSIEDLLPHVTGPYTQMAALWIVSGLFIVLLAAVGGRW